ncbi:hypothetical protein D3C79_912680 [compost metagenome]
MAIDDTVRQRQAQAGALADRLGGVEGVEDLLQALRRNAATVVGHFDPHVVVGATGAHGDGATFRAHGLGGIDHQVHDHLVDL